MRFGRPMNPVLARELKERMRTRRATIVLVIWLVLLGATLSVVYQAKAGETADVFGGPLATQSAAVGRTIFESLVFLMLVLVVLVVPGLTADAVTGERERQTLVPLQVTLLRPRSIVAGKLLASIAFVALLVVAALPMLGVAFVLGGVTIAQLAAGTGCVLATAVLVACVSIFCSSVAGRTQGAVVLALFLVLFLAVGGPAIYGAQRVFDDDGSHPGTGALLMSPFVASAAAVGETQSSSSPFGSIRQWLNESERRFDAGGRQVIQRNGGVMVVTSNGQLVEPDGFDLDGWAGIPFWIRSGLVLAAISFLTFVMAALRLRTPNDRTAA